MRARSFAGTLLILQMIIAVLSGCAPRGSLALRPASAEMGQEAFRFDTFGNEQYWTDTLHLELGIQRRLDPATAISLGLTIDMDALAAIYVEGMRDGTIDLKDPATMVELLAMDAVVGMRGTVIDVGGRDSLTRVGITCALCHSTVDDAVAPGIGHRLDGWPNRNLKLGAIIAISPVVSASEREIYLAQGTHGYGRIIVTTTGATVAYDLAAPGSVRNRFRAERLRGYFAQSPLVHEHGNPALAAVVNHYSVARQKQQSRRDKRALAEYLGTL
jgi:hypothetical protein